MLIENKNYYFYHVLYSFILYISAYSMSTNIRNDFIPLKIYDSGEKVKIVQEKLISLNYYYGPNGADGYFTNSTENCIKEFQFNNGLNVTGEIEEFTFNSLFSNDPIESINKTITSISSNNPCSIENVVNSYQNHKLIYRRRRDFHSNNLKENNLPVEASVSVDINDFLDQMASLYKFTIEITNGVRTNSPNGNDLEICYIDSHVVLSCYCHGSEKHFALAFGDEMSKSLYARPGEVACIKDKRSFISSWDHCESGVYIEEEDADLETEKKEKNFKKKRTWFWILIIGGVICLLLMLIGCPILYCIMKNREWCD